jgi:hypothetical protein
LDGGLAAHAHVPAAVGNLVVQTPEMMMPILVLFFVLLVGVLVGVLIGLIICANTALGDFRFTDTRRELLKCIIISVIIAAAGVGLFQLTHNGRVFLGLVPIFYLGLRLSWLDITVPEVLVISVTTIISIAVFSKIAFLLLI